MTQIQKALENETHARNTLSDLIDMKEDEIRRLSRERFAARDLLRQIAEGMDEKQPNISAQELGIYNAIQKVLIGAAVQPGTGGLLVKSDSLL